MSNLSINLWFLANNIKSYLDFEHKGENPRNVLELLETRLFIKL